MKHIGEKIYSGSVPEHIREKQREEEKRKKFSTQETKREPSPQLEYIGSKIFSGAAHRSPVQKTPQEKRAETKTTLRKPFRKTSQNDTYGKLQVILGDVLAEYGSVMSDPTIVVTMPTINDSNVPVTQEFEEVLFEALEVQDDIMSQNADMISSRYHHTLINTLYDKWDKALSFARETGMTGLDDRERRRAQTALNNIMSPLNENELKRNLELLERILSRVVYIDEHTGEKKNLDVRSILGKKEFSELVHGKMLELEQAHHHDDILIDLHADNKQKV